MPSGSLFVFGANLFTSFFFQFVGFLLTYLLHTSHAAKFGSRAGLGLTLIQYGFYSRSGSRGNGSGEENEGFGWPLPEPESSDPPLLSTSPDADAASEATVIGVTSREWLAFLLMTLGRPFCVHL